VTDISTEFSAEASLENLSVATVPESTWAGSRWQRGEHQPRPSKGKISKCFNDFSLKGKVKMRRWLDIGMRKVASAGTEPCTYAPRLSTLAVASTTLADWRQLLTELTTFERTNRVH
jgi:hypothetical protein